MRAGQLSSLAELSAQLVFRSHQGLLARRRQVPAGAVDVEGEHRQRGAEWISLAPPAPFGRPLQRGCDALGIARGKHAALEGKRVTLLGDTARPAASRRGPLSRRSGPAPTAGARGTPAVLFLCGCASLRHGYSPNLNRIALHARRRRAAFARSGERRLAPAGGGAK
jgi:hypothetical protein